MRAQPLRCHHRSLARNCRSTMDLTVPAELDALCRTVRAFVEREVDPVIPEIEETDRVPEAVLAKARDLGLFGMGIPEEYGGVAPGGLGRPPAYPRLGGTAPRVGPL